MQPLEGRINQQNGGVDPILEAHRATMEEKIQPDRNPLAAYFAWVAVGLRQNLKGIGEGFLPEPNQPLASRTKRIIADSLLSL